MVIKSNLNAKINITYNIRTNEVLQENHYYAFGERVCSRHTQWLVGEVKRNVRPAVKRGAVMKSKHFELLPKCFCGMAYEGPWLINEGAKDNSYMYIAKNLITIMD